MVLAAALVVFGTAGASSAATTASPTSSTSTLVAPAARRAEAGVQLADSRGGRDHDDSHERRSSHRYDDQYIFGLTRGIAEADMHPAVKILVFPITVPLDFVLLPFEVIGGLF